MHTGPIRHDMTRRGFCRTAALTVVTAAMATPVAVAAAQQATPASPSAQPATGGIATMLALAPASFPWADDPTQVMISYADLATQFAVTGVGPVDTMDDAGFSQWVAATRPLALPSDAAEYMAYWREDYGFDLFEADETLEVSLPPFTLTLYRGRFDNDAIRATLTQHDYQPADVDGHEILTLRDDYDVDVASPLAYKLAAMNHVTILDDGTIACSSVRAALEAVIAVAAGQAPSLMEQAGIAMLAGQTPAELVSAVIVSGTALAGNIPPELIDLEPGATPDFDVIATRVAQTSEMPPVVMVLLGTTAGGPLFGENIETPVGVPDAHGVVAALMLSPEAAETAVPVIEERLATGASANTRVPFSDYFPEADVQAIPSVPVVVVDLTFGPETPPNILISMLSSRDLGFLAW